MRVTESDYARLQQVATKLWPRAEMTDTARLWGVARIGIDLAPIGENTYSYFGLIIVCPMGGTIELA